MIRLIGVFLVLAVLMCSQAQAGDSPVKVAVLPSGAMLKTWESKENPNGKGVLRMQGDGNLVWYSNEKAVWSSRTGGTEDAFCAMQDDGNLVVYGKRNGKAGAVWSSNTFGHKGAFLACQDDGNLVIYITDSGKHFPIWDKDETTSKDAEKRRQLIASLTTPSLSGTIAGNLQNNYSSWWADAMISKRMTAPIEISEEFCKNKRQKETHVSFDDEDIDGKIISKNLYETAPGVPRETTLTYICETAMTITGVVGIEVGAKATIGNELIASASGEIKTKVEASLGITLSKSTIYTEKFFLDGKVTKVNVVWVERCRKGKATLADGKIVEVLVRVGARMKLEEVK